MYENEFFISAAAKQEIKRILISQNVATDCAFDIF